MLFGNRLFTLSKQTAYSEISGINTLYAHTLIAKTDHLVLHMLFGSADRHDCSVWLIRSRWSTGFADSKVKMRPLNIYDSFAQ